MTQEFDFSDTIFLSRRTMYVLSTALVFGAKALIRLLYRTQVNWITPVEEIEWRHIRLVVLLNHTSLFEPLFISAIPNRHLFHAVQRLVVPVADTTMERPILGRVFRAFAPGAIPITRKRDESWAQFMDAAGGLSLILIFPEGRMKRKDGRDKFGQPMTVKGGVADVLEKIDHGKMIIAYSGGLHHVQAPGEKIPRIFKTISVAVEQVDIPEYKTALGGPDFRLNVIRDLEARMKIHCPEVAIKDQQTSSTN